MFVAEKRQEVADVFGDLDSPQVVLTHAVDKDRRTTIVFVEGNGELLIQPDVGAGSVKFEFVGLD